MDTLRSQEEGVSSPPLALRMPVGSYGTMEHLHEREAIQRWRRGDPEGFSALVRRYQQPALQIATLILLNLDKAEDAVQEAFLRAWIHRERFRPGMPFWPWLRRLVIREALRLAEDRNRETPSELLDEANPALQMDPIVEIERDEELRRLAQALEALPPRQRTIVILYYYEELSIEAIAQTLDCSPGTVKWQLHDARERLRHMLQE